MKRLAWLLALGAILVFAFGTPAPARAALSFEDPQLCVNNQLLMVEPTTAGIEVWVRVGPELTVDFNVANCGGDPTLPAVTPDHVKYDGVKNRLEVAVKTKKFTNVLLHWNGNTHERNSGADGWVYARTKVN